MNDFSDIHPDLLAFFKASIEEMPYQALIQGAKKNPELIQGLNQKQPNAEQLRLRVQARISAKKIAPEIIELLKTATLSDSLISVLSEKAITQGFSSLCQRFGHITVVAAMVLDERESVRAKAQVEEANLNKTTAKSKLDDPFISRFKPLLTVLRSAIEETPAPVSLQTRTQPEQTSLSPAQIDNLIKSNSVYKQAIRERNELKQNLDTETTNCQSLTNELNKTKQELQTFKSLLSNMEMTQDKRVAAGIADALGRRIFPWLNQTERLNVKELSTDDPIKFAQNLIAQQVKLDQRFGTRTVKLVELRDAKDLLAQLKEAQAESLRPLPQLHDAMLVVQEHIIELEKLLNSTSHIQQAAKVQDLQNELSRIECLDELTRKKASFENTALKDAWDQDSIKQALWLFTKEATRIYDKTPLLTEKEPGERITALKQFQNCLLRAQPLRMLVDGHNFLFKVRPFVSTEHYTAAGVPNEKARSLLVGLLEHLCEVHPLVEIDVWFDGPIEENWTVTKGLRVWFSGGTGKNRADERILESLKALEYQGASTVSMVVSDDGDLLVKAKKLNAVGLSNLEAWTLLH